MIKRRVREKKANKQWSPLDGESYAKSNGHHLRVEHSKLIMFWSDVKYYANKSVARDAAERNHRFHKEQHKRIRETV